MQLRLTDFWIDILSVLFNVSESDKALFKSVIRIPTVCKLQEKIAKGSKVRSDLVDAAADCIENAIVSAIETWTLTDERKSYEKAQVKLDKELFKGICKQMLRDKNQLIE